jgi:flavorubredoxin
MSGEKIDIYAPRHDDILHKMLQEAVKLYDQNLLSLHNRIKIRTPRDNILVQSREEKTNKNSTPNRIHVMSHTAS